VKIFLAAPFTQDIHKKTGVMSNKKRFFIEQIIQFLTERGHTVMNAHVREEFGDKLMPPHECTKIDLEQVRDADLLIAFPGEPSSGGVHVEIGWAAAFQTKILLLLKKGATYSPVLKGLNSMAAVSNIDYTNETDMYTQLEKVISK
jgi:nucleoside 2-deoxyribosyltransferase